MGEAVDFFRDRLCYRPFEEHFSQRRDLSLNNLRELVARADYDDIVYHSFTSKYLEHVKTYGHSYDLKKIGSVYTDVMAHRLSLETRMTRRERKKVRKQLEKDRRNMERDEDFKPSPGSIGYGEIHFSE